MNRQTKSIIAACLLSTAGSIVYLISPILFGSAIESLNLTAKEAGAMLSSYFAGYTTITVSAVFWLAKSNSRRVALFSVLGFLAGLMIAAFAQSYATLVLAFACAGAGAGMLYGLSIAAIAETDNPDRYFGMALASQLALGSVLLFLGPSWIGPRWGLSGLFIGTAVFVSITGAAFVWLPEKLGVRKSAVQNSSDYSLTPAIMAIGGLLLWFAGISGLYAFVERIGAEGGLDGVQIGSVLSLTVITGISGAISATILTDRLGRTFPHIVGAVGLIAAMMMLSGGPDFLRYAAAIGVLTFTWNFWLAYSLGTIAGADFSGRLSVLTTAALGLGATLGPGVAGLLVADSNYRPLFTAVSVTILAGLLLMLWVLAKVTASTAARAAKVIESTESL